MVVNFKARNVTPSQTISPATNAPSSQFVSGDVRRINHVTGNGAFRPHQRQQLLRSNLKSPSSVKPASSVLFTTHPNRRRDHNATQRQFVMPSLDLSPLESTRHAAAVHEDIAKLERNAMNMTSSFACDSIEAIRVANDAVSVQNDLGEVNDDLGLPRW